MSNSELVPDGYYMAVGTPVETEHGTMYAQLGESTNGKEQVAITFELTEGEYAGRRLTWFGYFSTDKAAEMTMKALRNAGWKGQDLWAVTQQALNQPVSLNVISEEYEGKWRNKVNWVNAPGGGGIKLEKPMNDLKARAFAQRFAAKAASIPEVKTPPIQQQQQRATGTHGAGPVGDPDDVPF